MELEKQRGISVTSTVLQFDYRDCCVNLLDTPGHRDFSEDTYRLAFVFRSIQIDHHLVDMGLAGWNHAKELGSDHLVHIGDGLEHAFPSIAIWVAVAQFDRLVLPGGCAGWNGCGNGGAVG